MIPLAVDELRALALGRLEGAGTVTGVRVDSRLVEPGDLFVAVGRGGEFLAEARARGAAATLVPDDAFAALGAVARLVRDRSGARVVGITGSNGKTSTKDILAALCRPLARTVAAEASFNTEVGVPLTLCRVEPDTELVVLELAMRGFGQIEWLCSFARPEIGVVTNVGPAHLELVGSLEGVARAKGELVEALPAGGTAVVPHDFPVAREDVVVRRFGGPEAAVERFEPGRVSYRLDEITLDLDVSFTARHQATNLLAALLAFQALGFPLEAAREGAAAIAFSRWRGEELPLPGGGLLINDAYNANPASMRAALQHLVDRAGGRRAVAVLGEMAELGPDAPAYHAEVGRVAAELGVDAVYAYGELARHYGGACASELEELVARLRRELRPGDVVLVKASRAAGLERVAEALA